MSNSISVKTGDDWDLTITLQLNGVAQDVSTATEIKAALVTSDDNSAEELIAPVTCNSGATGANWATGIVVVEFPAASTALTEYGAKFLEIQSTIGGKKHTWPRVLVEVKKGVVS